MCSSAALLGITFAREWRPARHLIPFGIALGLIDRALVYALFQADLLSPGGFIIDTYCILLPPFWLIALRSQHNWNGNIRGCTGGFYYSAGAAYARRT